MQVLFAAATACLSIGFIIHTVHASFDQLEQLGGKLVQNLAVEYDVRLCAEIAALRRNLQDAERILSQMHPEDSPLWQRARQDIEHELDTIYAEALVPDAAGICASETGLTTQVHDQGHHGWPRNWPNAVARFVPSETAQQPRDASTP